MSDESNTSTAGSSDAGTGADASGAGDGGSGGTQGTEALVALAASLAEIGKQVSGLQSSVDKRFSELEKSTSAAGDPSGEPAGDAGAAPAGLTLEQMRSELRQTMAVQAGLAQARQDFPKADPSVFSGDFDSVEELRAAAEESHRWVVEQTQSGVADLEQRIKDAGGSLPDPTPAAGAGGGSPGLPKASDLAAMDQSEFEAFVEKHGEPVVNEILSSATA